MSNKILQNNKGENQEGLIIPTESLHSPFQRFLSQNKNIFFTGQYGIGKTTFLKEFFEEHEDKYDAYHLSPVRYHIHDNADVIELLKYDILLELTTNHKEALKTKNSEGISGFIELAIAFIREKVYLKNVLKSASKTTSDAALLIPEPTIMILGQLGRTLPEILDFDEKWQKFKNEYKKDEVGVIENLTENIRKTDTKEPDLLSALLSEKINKVKGDKKSVLILDDLDRIDPEHIFRILNVFSAHFHDDEREQNKFGFDNVILVGDYWNLEKIFYHKYGQGTDYKGYMNKFYTTKPYDLDMHKLIQEKINLVIAKLKHHPEIGVPIGRDSVFAFLLKVVLESAIEIKGCTLRELVSPTKNTFEVLGEKYTQNPFLNHDWTQITDLSIKMLIDILGGKERLLLILKKLIENKQLSPKSYVSRVASVQAGMMFKYLYPNLKAGDELSYADKKVYYKEEEQGVVKLELDNNQEIPKEIYFQVLIDYTQSGLYQKEKGYDF